MLVRAEVDKWVVDMAMERSPEINTALERAKLIIAELRAAGAHNTHNIEPGTQHTCNPHTLPLRTHTYAVN